jgi:hypothetical protein
MKTAIIALSAATLFAVAPVFAQSVSSKVPGHEMRAKAKKVHPGVSTTRAVCSGSLAAYRSRLQGHLLRSA